MYEAVKGVLRTFFYFFAPAFSSVVMVIIAVQIKSWLPIIAGVGTATTVFLVVVGRREKEGLQLQMKGLAVSPELQKQRFNEYVESLKHKEKQQP
jgi:hypothetical protein